MLCPYFTQAVPVYPFHFEYDRIRNKQILEVFALLRHTAVQFSLITKLITS